MSVDTGWFKSTYSSPTEENCVEVRITSETVGVRDSKNRLGPTFAFTTTSWRTFVAKVGD
jgi:hypothetical protein